ncbi:ABC transporter permease [Cellulomonas persica]|uniref:ABC3 transporter permease C-terminal domain-containing protein n=1 Tax=Cellulomonas persica TaxID=76861 RepID=A0A510UUL2_9CELL|nr:ABC transporter permease [Cellulomonas persica]GEK18259.1 hypothetical protein CPE01_19920 [Cellulomonas persica]
MIRLGARLTVTGGREALVRFVMTAAAVALGTGLLLTVLASLHAMTAQNQRYAWLETGFVPPEPGAAVAADPVWWQLRGDTFDNRTIGRVDVATTGPDGPLPPGIEALPGPGEYVASPAMVELLASTPDEQLAARYGSPTLVGTIGEAGLPSPDSLLVVVGRTPAELAASPHAQQVTSIATTAPDRCEGETCAVGLGLNADAVALVVGVVAVGLVLPIAVLLGSATRLSSARREQRFAAMRLVGATPRQIRTIAAIEAAITAATGTVLGFAVLAVLRPVVAQVPFTGSRFFPDDVTLTVQDVVLVVVGIPLLAAVAARVALRRAVVSPLGVARRTTPPAPGAWRVAPLVTGIAWLGALAVVGPPEGTDAQLAAYLGGVAVVVAGLVVAGPWLTRAGSRVLVARTRRPAALLAARRVGDDPRAAFRAVSGLTLALFIGTAATATVTTFVAERGPTSTPTSTGDLIVQHLDVRRPVDAAYRVPEGLTDDLRDIAGVGAAAVLRVGPDAPPEELGLGDHWGMPAYARCDDLADLPSLGACAPGAEVALLAFDAFTDDEGVTWPTAALDPGALAERDPLSVVVRTDGSTSAVETARTVLSAALPDAQTPWTVHEAQASSTSSLALYGRLADVVVAVSLVVGGCSLAVGAAAGVSERKRPFALLRLTGAPLALLRRVVTYETAVPLLVGALVAVSAGFGAAQLFLRAQLGYDVHAPGTGYWIAVGIGLAVALGVIASTFDLLRRTTDPATTRTE